MINPGRFSRRVARVTLPATVETRMLRQAQLKSAFAGDYPALEPGVWYTAAAAAALIKATRIVNEGPDVEFENRVLSGTHFEFRGGERRRGSWLGMRTRRADRHAHALHTA